jgi:hypothetical protein
MTCLTQPSISGLDEKEYLLIILNCSSPLGTWKSRLL